MAVTGYELRINGGSYTNHIIDVGNVTSYQINGLTTSTLYSIEVRSYDGAGNRSGWSSVATGTPANPISMGSLPGIDFWFEADLEAYSNNDPVGSLTDQTVNGCNPTSTGSNRPTYILAEPNLNNKPCISFDGTDDFLLWTNGGSTSRTTYTFGFVYSDYTPDGTGETLFSPNGHQDLWRKDSPTVYYYFIDGYANTVTPFILPTKGMIIVKVNPSVDNVKIYVNGSSIFDGALAVPITSPAFNKQISFGLYSSNYVQAKIAMAFSTTSLLDTTTINSLFNDNRTKYNLY